MNLLSLPLYFLLEMEKTGKIIKIGNSHGVIVPASILKELSWNTQDELKMSIYNNTLYIKKTEPYTGPYTGIFADMPRPDPSEPDPWEGKTSEEIVDELRAGRYDRPKDLDW